MALDASQKRPRDWRLRLSLGPSPRSPCDDITFHLKGEAFAIISTSDLVPGSHHDRSRTPGSEVGESTRTSRQRARAEPHGHQRAGPGIPNPLILLRINAFRFSPRTSFNLGGPTPPSKFFCHQCDAGTTCGGTRGGSKFLQAVPRQVLGLP